MHDVAIVGCGPAGIFAACELSLLHPGLKIAIVEEGHDIERRICPVAENKVDRCVKCSPCGIMRGFGGAGAYSDGKYNFTTSFGGWLSDYIADGDVLALIDYVDQVNVRLGAPGKVFTSAGSRISHEALKHDLHLLEASVRHLGTENNLLILKRMYEHLSVRVEMIFDTMVQSMHPQADGTHTLSLAPAHRGRAEAAATAEAEAAAPPQSLSCRYLIAAPGRAGAEWFSTQCTDMGLKLINNQVDVGVRVELPAGVFKHITDEVYEAKLLYRTRQYGDIVRTFCMNPYGYVVAENTNGIVTVNGHSFDDPALASPNTNFALLVSNRFTEPFNEPHQYGKRIASFSNMLGGGVLVQRFGDLIRGRRTNEHRMGKSFTKPTLSATPGDLSLCLPKRHLDNIIEMIYALDKVAPGTANEDTLLYGVEVKFYSARIELSSELETKLPGMFAIGDGAGVTRGLSQASASGVHVGRIIAERVRRQG